VAVIFEAVVVVVVIVVVCGHNFLAVFAVADIFMAVAAVAVIRHRLTRHYLWPSL